MDLQKMSFTELQALFDRAVKNWKANDLQIDRVKKRECEKYSDFVRCRADLRQLSRENAKMHNLMIRIDLELQIRTWAGKND